MIAVEEENVIKKLYNYAYNTAEKFGPYSSECHLFLWELYEYSERAHDMCCSTISADIIGG